MRQPGTTLEEQKRLYSHGENALLSSTSNPNNNKNDLKSARTSGKPRSLASLSTDSYSVMKDDPMYGFFVASFRALGTDIEGETKGTFDDQPVSQYANTLVNDLFELQMGGSFQSDAALLYNVWMYVVHQLYASQRACEQNDADAMNAAVDIAAALYLGSRGDGTDNLPAASSSSSPHGYMLYDMAERMSHHFYKGTESSSNTLFLSTLNDLQSRANDGSCAEPDTHLQVRSVVRDAIGHMTVPMIQTMIHLLLQAKTKERDNYLEMYALALAPRLAVCDPTIHDTFLSLFVQDQKAAAYDMGAVAILQSTYSCFPITCDHVGVYHSNKLPACSEEDAEPMIAGYQAQSAVVTPVSINALVVL